MKQRISVRAIIRKDGKTLLLRRVGGRPSIAGKYELPGGKLGYGEQPDDALSRYLRDVLGVKASTSQLFDVLTYVDEDDSAIQYVFILYLVDISNSRIRLSRKYNLYGWREVSGIQTSEITSSTNLLLKITQNHDKSSLKLVNHVVVEDTSRDSNHYIVYSDGGSRGNPGPSSSGYVVMNTSEEVIDEGGAYLGITTNNLAEYHGVRLGLERALELGARTVDFRIDSLLVVNQMNGIYKIKNRELWPVNERITALVKLFDKVTFSHVKREFNQLADGMVNKILDARAGK